MRDWNSLEESTCLSDLRKVTIKSRNRLLFLKDKETETWKRLLPLEGEENYLTSQIGDQEGIFHSLFPGSSGLKAFYSY